MVVVGIDPDSAKHGVAIYTDGKLVGLHGMELLDIKAMIEDLGEEEIVFSIENVMANQFVYDRNKQESKASQSKVAMYIGRCQQAQVELMRLLDRMKIPYQLVKPTSGNWAKRKGLFEKLTGWTGRSNEDTRSAAYFGYLLARGSK